MHVRGVRSDAHAVGLNLGEQHPWIEQILVTRSELRIILAIRLDAQLHERRDIAFQAHDDVVHALCRKESLDAIFNLQLAYPITDLELWLVAAGV